MRLTIFFCSFLMLSSAEAIRRVGFGGGPAELRLHHMAEYLPAYFKACTENPEICGDVASNGFAKNVLALKITGDSYQAPFCEDGEVVLSCDLLYHGAKIAKSDLQLAQLLFAGILACEGKTIDPVMLAVPVIPSGHRWVGTKLVTFKGANSDFVTSEVSHENVHQKLMQGSECASYRIVSYNIKGSAILQCLDDPWQFEVNALESEGRVQFLFHYLVD